jgi:hypothetical protein
MCAMITKKSGQIRCGSDLPQEKLVKAYAKTLSTDRDPRIFDSRIRDLILRYSKLSKAEIVKAIAQADSLGYSNSKYEYEQIEEQIRRFEGSNVPYFGWNRNFKKAKDYLLNEMRKGHLKSLVFRGNSDIMDSLPRKDTHAGASYLVTGLKKKGEYEGSIFSDVIKAEEEARRKGTFGQPLMIGIKNRGSMPFDNDGVYLAKYKTKSRLVSMVDIKVIVSELRYAKPFQQYLSTFDWYAGGKDDVQLSVLINNWRYSYKHWLSIDYSSYDQSISNWLIMESFDVIESCFAHDPNFDKLLFKAIKHDFCNKHFIDGSGKLRYSNKGVPSGSMFTQIIDTLVNRLMVLTYVFAKGIDINDVRMCIMGDDNIIFTREGLSRDDLEGYLNSNFGVLVNASKSSAGTRDQDPEFLSRHWSYGGARRCWKHLVLRMCYPERFRDYRGGKIHPELVLYSYILAYPITMAGVIDLHDFYYDYPNLENRLRKEGVQGLDGYAAYRAKYLSK